MFSDASSSPRAMPGSGPEREAIAAPVRRFCIRVWLMMVLTLLVFPVSMSSASNALAVSKAHLLPAHPAPGQHNTKPLTAGFSANGTGHDPACSGCGTPPLIFKGGSIQTTPRVYLVFWGSKWKTDSDGVIPQMKNLFNYLAGGMYNDILSQYGVQNNVLFNPESSVWIDSNSLPTRLSLSSTLTEASFAIEQHGWTDDLNTNVIVFPQKGAAYNPVDINARNICGRHDLGIDNAHKKITVSLVRYASDFYTPTKNCMPTSDNVADSMTQTASHEYAEDATDPNPGLDPSSWVTSDYQEIGDLCNRDGYDYHAVVAPFSSRKVVVQELWSNKDQACVAAVGQEYTSPTSPYMHTVQGAILGHYTDHNNAIMNLVGQPTSEEVGVGSGRVSYFAGDGCGSFSGPYSSKSAIYWSPGPGTWEVGGCIYQHYLTPGGDLQGQGGPTTKLGFPTSDVLSISGGFVSYFAGNKCGSSGPNHSGSAIYYHNSTAAFVTGCIYSTYIGDGGYQSYIGFPVSDEVYYSSQGTYASYFAGNKCGYYSHPYGSGTAIYTDSYGTFVVSGCIYDAYIDYHEYNGPLGVPTSDTTRISGGWVNQFNGTNCASGLWQGSGSAIYTAKDTSEVQGCIYQEYLHMGGSSGALGFPLSNELPIGGYNGVNGHVSYFAGGNCGNPGTDNSNSAIYDTPATGAHEVQGCIYASYLKYGGPGSRLGFPISDEYTGSTGYRESDFTGGTILWTGSGASIILN